MPKYIYFVLRFKLFWHCNIVISGEMFLRLKVVLCLHLQELSLKF